MFRIQIRVKAWVQARVWVWFGLGLTKPSTNKNNFLYYCGAYKGHTYGRKC